MKRLRSTIGGVTLACAAISACGGDSSNTSQTIGKGCATDRDCNAGELCDRDTLVCVFGSPDGGPGAGGSGATAGDGGSAGSGAAAGGGGVAGSGAAAGGGGIAGSGAAGASTGGSATGGSAGTGTGTCGDGLVDRASEECDDGNTSTGDGCDGACSVETPPACGDGSLDFSTGEECDDGATAPGDGCSATCQLETVGASCGNAQVDPSETCDDGNTTNGDACNPTCNLANNVTTFFTQVNGNESTIAVDQDDIWLADSGDCATGTTPGSLRRIPIAGGNATTIAPLPGCAAAGIATDGLGTVWVATGDIATGNAVIVEIDTTAVSPTANIVAGNNPCAAGVYTDDSAGNTACFSGIRGLTWWAGQLYIVDPAAGVIRRLDPSTNQVFNVAGDPFNNGYQDGTGTGARFDSPRYIVSDGSANLYVSETNIGAIRVVNAVTGAVSTLAGNGVPGYQDGVGTAGRMHRPRGITSDGTSVYYVEFNAHAVRQIELATGSLTTLAGNVTTCASAANCTGGDVCANGVCLPASSGPPVGGGFVDGVGTAAEFFAPFSIAWHFPSRSLFVVDAVNSAIRRIQ